MSHKPFIPRSYGIGSSITDTTCFRGGYQRLSSPCQRLDFKTKTNRFIIVPCIHIRRHWVFYGDIRGRALVTEPITSASVLSRFPNRQSSSLSIMVTFGRYHRRQTVTSITYELEIWTLLKHLNGFFSNIWSIPNGEIVERGFNNPHYREHPYCHSCGAVGFCVTRGRISTMCAF